MPDASRIPEAHETGPGSKPAFLYLAEFDHSRSDHEQLNAASRADACSITWTFK